MTHPDIIAYVQNLRSSARFVRCVHSGEFEGGYPGQPLYYVSLYDHEIDSALMVSKRHGLILVENTYLSSFAYNLLLAWMVGSNEPRFNRTALVRYNLKKFFAEQLLRVKNCTVSRALFLETLLYEQGLMVEVFNELSQPGPTSELIQQAVDTMTQVTRLHELSHHYLTVAAEQWLQLAGDYGPIASMVESLGNDVSPALLIELKCDVLGAIHDFQGAATDEARCNCLKSVVFGFATFAVMTSLCRSAERTIHDHYLHEEVVDFSSMTPIGGMLDCSFAIDENFLLRAQVMQKVCEQLATMHGLVLYDDGSLFSLPKTIIDQLIQQLNTLLYSDDQNARNISLIVATALHDHPRGVEYLTFQSKKFRPKMSGP